MPVRILSEYLEQNDVHYHCYNHPPAITALEVAESAHIPGRQLAKTVIVWVDGSIAMAVLPSTEKIDLERLRVAIGAHRVGFAEEMEFNALFPDCEAGGMPPMGNLYQLPVYMDGALLDEDWIAFNAGTHTEIVKMDTEEFVRLVNPVILGFTLLH